MFGFPPLSSERPIMGPFDGAAVIVTCDREGRTGFHPPVLVDVLPAQVGYQRYPVFGTDQFLLVPR